MTNRTAAIIDIALLDHPVCALGFHPFPQPAGAECVFLGRSRAEKHSVHGRLVRLSYEAYRPLAESTLRNLAQQAAERWKCLAVRVHHALGEVPISEASVVVEVACGHRDAAFEACRFLIDRLKVEAPIWKREEWEDGATWSAGSPVSVGQEPSR